MWQLSEVPPALAGLETWKSLGWHEQAAVNHMSPQNKCSWFSWHTLVPDQHHKPRSVFGRHIRRRICTTGRTRVTVITVRSVIWVTFTSATVRGFGRTVQIGIRHGAFSLRATVSSSDETRTMASEASQRQWQMQRMPWRGQWHKCRSTHTKKLNR